MAAHVRLNAAAAAELARRIKHARTSRGLTQEVVAQRAGFARPQLTYIELRRRGVSVGALVAIARALDTDPAEFVTGLHKL